ncbi:hypothetical protein EON66_02505 [archaeon]|nr:MAG: hypothetical protein EON66_02505 [archaeon]
MQPTGTLLRVRAGSAHTQSVRAGSKTMALRALKGVAISSLKPLLKAYIDEDSLHADVVDVGLDGSLTLRNVVCACSATCGGQRTPTCMIVHAKLGARAACVYAPPRCARSLACVVQKLNVASLVATLGLDLPVQVQFACVEELRLGVCWTELLSAPISLQLRGLYVLATTSKVSPARVQLEGAHCPAHPRSARRATVPCCR